MKHTKRILGLWSRRTLLPAAALLIVACAAAPEESASIAWADRTHKQRAQFMKKVVLPEMKAILQRFDPEIGEVNCATCHGENPKAAKFAMPSGDLPELDPADHFAAHEERDVEFMSSEVSPKVAELLGVEPWSPESPQGFGCFSCHPSSEG